MKLFLDTSSLVKLYHKEAGTEEIEYIFTNHTITEIFLLEITKIEFQSAIWKKVRTKEVTAVTAVTKMRLFEQDFLKYTFITMDNLILEGARILILKYGIKGLRTLDSIQLSTCKTLFEKAHVFLTSDQLLKTLLKAEGLPTELSIL